MSRTERRLALIARSARKNAAIDHVADHAAAGRDDGESSPSDGALFETHELDVAPPSVRSTFRIGAGE